MKQKVRQENMSSRLSDSLKIKVRQGKQFFICGDFGSAQSPGTAI